MDLTCPFERLSFGCKLFSESCCGGLCGFVCQCCMCNNLGKLMESQFASWALWEVGSFGLSMVLSDQ